LRGLKEGLSDAKDAGHFVRKGSTAAIRPPTEKQREFARLIVEEYNSLSQAYRSVYRPRGEGRSAKAVHVEAKRLARSPAVLEAMREVRVRLWMQDPERQYWDALAGLEAVATGKADPSRRLALVAILREARARLKETERAERETFRAMTERLTALGLAMSARSRRTKQEKTAPAATPPPMPADDPQSTNAAVGSAPAPRNSGNERRSREIANVIAQRQQARGMAGTRSPARPQHPGHGPFY
jgi:hypothetical protein